MMVLTVCPLEAALHIHCINILYTSLYNNNTEKPRFSTTIKTTHTVYIHLKSNRMTTCDKTDNLARVGKAATFYAKGSDNLHRKCISSINLKMSFKRPKHELLSQPQ